MNMVRLTRNGWIILITGLCITLLLYWPGLSGGWLFDDYPNIVDNPGVQPQHIGLASLVRAALSSPASEFKRPLASLSFALNYVMAGLDPFWMKLTNLVIHLLNGVLIFIFSRKLFSLKQLCIESRHGACVAALIASAWLLLPINLTSVLYIVQRMESMANFFVLLGLIGYVTGRQRMLELNDSTSPPAAEEPRRGALSICVASLIIPTVIGLLAKETAILLPLYALLVEWILFGFKKRGNQWTDGHEKRRPSHDWRITALFLLLLILPGIVGATLLLPGVLNPSAWATRNFTLSTRLLSESRVVVDYVVWTLLPSPDALSFYHDDFTVSTALLSPWTTLASLICITSLAVAVCLLRKRNPLVALGIALFLGCHLLTATILPLELVYEHRNYFASFGLLLAVVPFLAAPRSTPLAFPRWILGTALIIYCATITALTAYAWGDPLRLAEVLAARGPQSPRAQYELGRTYIIYSQYDPTSPFIKLAYKTLEKASSLPDSSILPEQALIFMNGRMHLPLKKEWWDSMIMKLRSTKPAVQDESSLGALTQCARDHECDLPEQSMTQAFMAALSHPNPSARLLAMYSDYAWNVLNDHTLGLAMISKAVQVNPGEAAYRITQARMYISEGNNVKASETIDALRKLNIGGSLDASISQLQDAM